MKISTYLKIAAVFLVSLIVLPIQAQETSITTPIADTYVRKGNTNNNGSKDNIELQTSTTKGRDFVGLMKFSFTKPNSGYSVKKATLRLASKRIKGNREVAIYAFTSDFSESVKYEEIETALTEARATTALATFEMRGQSNKDFQIDAVGADYRTIAAWTNEIDLTDYVKGLSTETFSIMLARTATDDANSNQLFSKEATDFTNEADADNTFTVSATDLIPQLTVEYEKNEAMKTSTTTATKDTWIRSDKTTADYTEKATMEIKSYTDETDATKDRYFYGLMSFQIPTEALDTDKYLLRSATLRLITERIKGGSEIAIYSCNEYPEKPQYSDVEQTINTLSSATPVATFTMKGQWNKALGIDEIGDDYKDLSAWTNEIDLTDYVKGLTNSEINFLLAATANNNNSACFYTSDAVDVANSKDETLTFKAEDLKPILTVTYETKETSAIASVSTEATRTVEGIYTLQGVKVERISQPGIYIINGKKFVKR